MFVVLVPAIVDVAVPVMVNVAVPFIAECWYCPYSIGVCSIDGVAVNPVGIMSSITMLVAVSGPLLVAVTV